MSGERLSDERLAEAVEAADSWTEGPPGHGYGAECSRLGALLADLLAEVGRLRKIEAAASRMFDAFAGLNGWEIPIPPAIDAAAKAWCDCTDALREALAAADDGGTEP